MSKAPPLSQFMEQRQAVTSARRHQMLEALLVAFMGGPDGPDMNSYLRGMALLMAHTAAGDIPADQAKAAAQMGEQFLAAVTANQMLQTKKQADSADANSLLAAAAAGAPTIEPQFTVSDQGEPAFELLVDGRPVKVERD